MLKFARCIIKFDWLIYRFWDVFAAKLWKQQIFFDFYQKSKAKEMVKEEEEKGKNFGE